MSDPLLPDQSVFSESREGSVTRQFYDWEMRGRGWHVYRFPVALEPPFRPMSILDAGPENIIDDGRTPTFLSRLFEGSQTNPVSRSSRDYSNAEFREVIAELDQPVLCNYYESGFHELKIILPQDLKISKAISEQLLSSLSYCANPVSFEMIGSQEEVIIQMAATESDLEQLQQQLKAYLPNTLILKPRKRVLENFWDTAGGQPQIVDFGLSHEFMIPLSVIPNLETDPLVSIVGAISELRDAEVGVFQVLFQKTKADWASEILNSVRFFDGTPFFVNAPEMIPFAKQKVSSALFSVVIRVAAKSPDSGRTWQIIRALGASLTRLSTPMSNELIPLSNDNYDIGYHEQAFLNRFSFRSGMIFNLEELASLVHVPSPSVRSEKLLRESEQTKAAPQAALGHSLVLGNNDHQDQTHEVTLSCEQRTRHTHVIGSSGSGKSTLLLNLIRQDMEAGQGVCVMDPHGDLIDDVIARTPASRTDDVILFDPSDSEYPIGFNILQANSELEKTILSSDLVATFRRLSTSWGDVMDAVLANAVLAILESTNGGTLLDLKKFLIEKTFREEFLTTVTDESIRYFWNQEFPMIANKPQSSILIRLDTFLRQKLIRNVVCQKETKLNFRDIMDNQKVLLIKLSQGLIGEENALLLGTLLVSKLYQTALSRQETRNRPNFWLYIDEFQHFITPSMENILSGARKYNLGLTLSHQEFRQLQSRNQDVASSVLSNCYTRLCFRLGDADAEKLASGFSFFDAKSLQNLSIGQAIGRIERAEYDFNLQTFLLAAVDPELSQRRKQQIVNYSRTAFARPKSEVEATFQLTKPIPTSPTSDHLDANKSEVIDDKVSPHSATAEELEVALPKSHEIKPKDVREAPVAAQLPQHSSVPEAQQHRYLQTLVKRIAEAKGFRVTLEKEVFGGIGRIDVALENEVRKIACEISVKNEADYEIQNIRKCISAGYQSVVLISPDARHLAKIRQLARDSLTNEHFQITRFVSPDEFFSWLDNFDLNETNGAETIKGFKVKVNLKSVGQAEQSTRKRAISDVVFGALRRLKNKDTKR